MRLEISLGNNQQREQIRAELQPLAHALEELGGSLKIKAIVVPDDFDATINRLQGTMTYRSIKDTSSSGIVAIAKIIKSANKNTIVLSSRLYSEDNDNQTRGFIILHDVMHAINSQELAFPAAVNSARDINLQNLYSLYDEYLADYRAFEIVDLTYPEKSDRWRSLIETQTIQYLEVTSDQVYPQRLNSALAAYGHQKDMDALLTQIRPIISILSISITHLFSNIHYRQLSLDEIDWRNSPYINETTIDLMEHFKRAADQGERRIDKLESKIAKLFELFGIRYIDRDNEIICELLR